MRKPWPSRVSGLLARRARLDPDRTAIVSDDIRLTYAQLDERVNAAGRMLNSLRVHRGDRVAVLARNSTEYLELYFAAAKCGTVLCGINVRLSLPEMRAILADCGARLLFADAEFADVATWLAQEADVKLIGLKGDVGPVSYHQLRSGEPGGELSEEGGADDPLVLVYTSGTTGRPKGAVLTQTQMFWSSATQIGTLDVRQRDVHMIGAPLFHVGGLAFATLFVHAGMTALILPQWEPARVLRLISQERVNHFFAVPAMLRLLSEHIGESRIDLSSLRWIMSGASAMPVHLIERFASYGIPVLASYGATETAGPAAVLDLDRFLSKAGTVGRPFFHTDIRISPSAVERTSGVGEIQIRAPHLFQGYWNDPSSTAAAFDDEWLRTGDLGWFDPDGDLHIAGRIKDLIISGGENVYPAEVELILQAHPAITEVAVVGIPHQDWGESVCAVVVLKEGAQLNLDALQDFCRGKIARYKIPRALWVRTAPLPRNASGKLLSQAILTNIDLTRLITK
jgi:fatty-acyl-CoA synthase